MAALTPPSTRLTAAVSLALPAPLESLCQHRRWLGWRPESAANGRAKKVPIHPASGRKIDGTDPSNWVSYEEALVAVTDGRCDGIGYALTPDDDVIALDIDKCRNPLNGEVDSWASDLVRYFDSYTEVSPSGTGIHIWLKGGATPSATVGRFAGHKVEVYSHNRFITVTGKAIHNAPIRDRTEDLARWLADVFSDRPTKTDDSGSAPQLVVAPSADPALDDDTLLSKARAARSGPKFDHLWSGDTHDYGGDESRADFALVSTLCFWTPDDSQVDRLFRQSGLMRAKWDARRGDRTYGERTIARARSGQTEHYDATHQQSGASGAKPLPNDVATLQAMVRERDRQIALLQGLQSRTVRILANRKLGPERITAAVLAYDFGNREAAGDAGRQGTWRVSRARIAERAGISEDTVTDHVKRLKAANLLKSETVTVPERVDVDTGEIMPLHRELWIGPRQAGPLSYAEAAASSARPPSAKPKAGGYRPCPEHPHAPVVKRTRHECSVCQRILDLSGKEKQETLPPAVNWPLSQHGTAVVTETPTALEGGGDALGPDPSIPPERQDDALVHQPNRHDDVLAQNRDLEGDGGGDEEDSNRCTAGAEEDTLDWAPDDCSDDEWELTKAGNPRNLGVNHGWGVEEAGTGMDSTTTTTTFDQPPMRPAPAGTAGDDWWTR